MSAKPSLIDNFKALPSGTRNGIILGVIVLAMFVYGTMTGTESNEVAKKKEQKDTFSVVNPGSTQATEGIASTLANAEKKMNAQALQIQVELALRSLAITMTADDIRWHRLATVAPVVITEAEELERVAYWFRRLRSANASRHAFDGPRFDRALSRQWTTVVRAATRSGLSRSTVATAAAAGFRTIGVSPASIAMSASAGVRRRLSRRT